MWTWPLIEIKLNFKTRKFNLVQTDQRCGFRKVKKSLSGGQRYLDFEQLAPV